MVMDPFTELRDTIRMIYSQDRTACNPNPRIIERWKETPKPRSFNYTVGIGKCDKPAARN